MFIHFSKGVSLDLLTDLPNKVNKFGSRWFIVIPPPSWDAPQVWNYEDACDMGLPLARDVRRVYKRIINDLIAEGSVELSSLLSIENIQEAGWGVSVVSVGALDPIRLDMLYTDNCNHIYY